MRPQALSRRLTLAGTAAVVVVALDLWTKRWAAARFSTGAEEVIPGLLTFTYAENPGSAFSLFQGAGSFLGLAAVVAVGVIAYTLREPRPTGEVVGLGMIAGGAVGNLIDRVARGDGWLDGRVIDWIQLPHWPVFNLADSSITVGVGLLLLTAWRYRSPTEQ